MLETKIITIPLGRDQIRHAYLLLVSGEGVLFDPGGFATAESLYETLKKHLPIKRIRSVILQCTHCSNTAALHYLNDRGLTATVYHNSDGSLDLASSLEGRHIRDMNYEVSLKNEETFTFIPAPFLPYPDAFMTFFSGRNALFSSNVFSQSDKDQNTTDALKTSLRTFHERYMPSSEFLRPVLRQLEDYPLRSIYPASGSPIKGDAVKTAISTLLKADFYNTDLVRTNSRNKQKRYNYHLILNHMMKWLESYYDAAEIMDVFKDSPITVEHKIALEVKESQLSGYKLWNRFFEEIYRKKGIEWLALLEPVMRKYTRSYNIKQPSIYKSELVRGKLKLKSLNEERDELTSRVETLNKKLEKTMEQLVRCPITDLYNARFFRRHLQNAIQEPLPENQTRGFLSIRIDAFSELNRKHGKASGDETLQNAAYLIDSLKPEDTLFFRGDGPGFYLYFSEITEEAMRQEAVTIRNSVKDSSLFIESITVSIAVVTVKETERSDVVQASLELVEIAKKRLEVAQRKGGGQIIDASNDSGNGSEGTILLVDEDETMHNLMVQIFARIQFDVHVSEDIYAALEYVRSAKVDVIISEINLAKLDGLQFKRWLNDSPSFKDIPFIIASHHKNRDVIKRANALDIELVLRKPIIPEELIGHVKRMREGRRGV